MSVLPSRIPSRHNANVDGIVVLCKQKLHAIVSRFLFTSTPFRCVRKFAKTDYSLVMSIRLHGTARLPLDRFLNKILFLNIFRKSFEIKVSLKCDKNNGYFT